MAEKGKRLSARQRAPRTRGRMCIHEDRLPGIIPIPFKLDDNDEEDKVMMKRDGFKLHLPHVHFYSRVPHFELYLKAEYNERTYPEFNYGTSQIPIPADPSPRNQSSKLYLHKLDTTESLQRNVKKKLGIFLSNKRISFSIRSQKISLAPFGANIKQQNPRDGSSAEIPERISESKMLKLYNWSNCADLPLDQTLLNIRKKSSALYVETDILQPAHKLRIRIDLFKCLSLISRAMNTFLQLNSFMELSCRAIVPDLLKMLAFTMWQKGSTSKSLLYLCESQNFFTRREVLEKHSSYFVRKSTERCHEIYNAGTYLEDKKEELFRIQSKELRCYGIDQQRFENNLQKLNQEWNVIQLTTLFHHKNRFGTSQNPGFEAFAIFISAFVNINLDGLRCPFVTYQPAPLFEPGVSKHNIIENLRILMTKNRKLNEHFKGGRKKYWRLRSRQNFELKSLLDTVEENWINPWEFLFHGNIKDKSVVSFIWNSLEKMQKMLLVNFTRDIQGVLYKLVENYTLLNPVLRNDLQRFIIWLTGASDQTSAEIAALIAADGSTLKPHCYVRSPTVLILDQELELIPWESMNCLRATPVTRVPAISLMHSLTVLRKLKKEKYGEKIDPKSCGYVLNPDGTLKGVEERLSGYFGAVVSWSGVTGRKPTLIDFETYFQKKDLYLYCGHGSGSAYYSEHRIQRIFCRAIPLLMGCGSVRYKHHGPRSLSTSFVTSLFSAASVCCVGFLYEVTDLECDRVTLELLEHWAPGAKGKLPNIISFDAKAKRHRERCLANAVRLARGGATQFLTSAGLVCYGIPVLTQDF